MATSPGWKKPSGLMRVKRKRASIASPAPQDITPSPTVKRERKKQSAKRRNPFGQNKTLPQSDSKIEVSSLQDGNVLFDALENIDPKRRKLNEQPSSVASIEECLSTDEITRINNDVNGDVSNDVDNEGVEPEKTSQTFPWYPVDWCLKTKVRFLSDTSFSWAGQLKSKDEAEGVTAFVTQNGHLNTPCEKSGLQSCSMYWMHPNLPWLKLFPRIAPDKSIGPMTPLTQDEDLQKSLLSDWTSSFTSLFQLLRCQLCPYFYVCCHQFTVLFHCDNKTNHALITPTTRGFREALKTEGVEFTMPLNPLNKQDEKDDENEEENKTTVQEQAVSTDDHADDEVDDIAGTDAGASTWLEELGLDKAKYRSLDPNKVKLQRDIFKTIDNRPESLLHIDSDNIFALFNFLLNCRTCIASSGTQTGIPPTLLAPVAFQGATLKSLKIKQSTIRQQHPNGSIHLSHSLELQGPLLPSNLNALHSLLCAKQEQFTATYSVHEPCTPFNACPCLTENKDSETVDKHGAKHTRVNEDNNNGKQAIREIECKKGEYLWLT